MIEDAKSACSDKMRKAIEHLREEFGAIRTGRATPALVEKLRGAAKVERRVEPLESPLVDGARGGVRVPSWRPTSKNAAPGRDNPHGIGGAVPLSP